jgi:cytochrome bd ubiquinol oxidase subunit I
VRGINDVESEYVRRYGPGEYVPIVAVTYWTFRAMIGAGLAMILIAGFGWWLVRRGRLHASPRFLRLIVAAVVLPFVANSAGWIFTEMGRQPWVVQGLLKTSDAVSPNVSSAEIWLSLGSFTVLYGVLAAVAGWVFLRFAKAGPKADAASEPDPGRPDLTLAY